MSRRQKEFLSIAPGMKSGVSVVNGDINFAIRQFKRVTKKSGILFEYKNRSHFIKPTTKKRKKRLAIKPTTKKRKKRLAAIFSQRLDSKRSK